MMSIDIENRLAILQSLREELVGPAPAGEELDCSAALHFATPEDARGPYRQKNTGEEILMRDSPHVQYGVGVLYPVGAIREQEANPDVEEGSSSPKATSEVVQESAVRDIEAIQRREDGRGQDDDADSFSLASANAFRQGSMGISFLAEIPRDSDLVVEVTGGRYRDKPVHIGSTGQQYTWWLREPVTLRARFGADALCPTGENIAPASEIVTTGMEGLDLRVEVYTRPHGGITNQRLLTVVLVNRTAHGTRADAMCLYQSHFSVRVVRPGSVDTDGQQIRETRLPAILPYPEQNMQSPDPEERAIALLYRSRPTYSVGHGCAADWPAEAVGDRKYEVSAVCLPEVEVPSITSDVIQANGSPVEVPMALLAGLEPNRDGFLELQQVIDLYRGWTADRRAEIHKVPTGVQDVARDHLDQCDRCAARMQEGLDHLRKPEQAHRALRAFRLANHAMLLQQICGGRTRGARYDDQQDRLVFDPAYQQPDTHNLPPRRGRWRAFQIAFLLMSLRSVAEGEDPNRDLVELIWFPTGGGKTEAYFGLASFAVFLRRIENAGDVGVNVLMRYTLRLLTAQQFQRAAGLICAMDYLRRQPQNDDLGQSPFSIGIWVGGDTTPNSGEKAQQALRALANNPRAENPFLLGRCPWCGAFMGRLEGQARQASARKGTRRDGRKAGAAGLRVVGYVPTANSVAFRCFDVSCPFSDGLPVHVIDEAIYTEAPTLVIGTVDKFAQLAWKPEARSLFGLKSDGQRRSSPPGLIIQDELHLISGPLGSMVGLYETLIEELCTDRRGREPVLPKIVCSTATIRRFSDQVKALYARSRTALFPPPGLDAGDSFFATYARDRSKEGHPLLPGKIYVGIHAPGHSSLLTTQVRTDAALLQAPVGMPAGEADPWWTLLIFFNSIRELGGALTLFQADIPERLDQMRSRLGLNYSEIRKLWHIKELTSRLRNDEVPEAITELQREFDGRPGSATDVCLASNIIEVGVDIDRLSLMSVVGQPKTTSQYIQVTGRVGRRWDERPGVVVTLYNPGKPRDRSHFEKFRSYHERLYAQVEPTSVTPFSPPLLDRALHAVMVAHIRQVGTEADIDMPYPCPEPLIDAFRDILLPRVRAVDPPEEENVRRVLEKRRREWERWGRTRWQGTSLGEDIPLLRPAGDYAPPGMVRLSWSTPTSLRNVDAECQAQTTQLYLEDPENGNIPLTHAPVAGAVPASATQGLTSDDPISATAEGNPEGGHD